MAAPDPATHRGPRRTCIGCRTAFPQHRVVRCVLGQEGPVVDRVAPGRGAWLCSPECLDAAIRRRAFDRAWRCSVDEGAVGALREGVEAWWAERPAPPGAA
ncbi:MAG: YlxR family protein [Ilumatobacteraceae bacterium]